MRYEIAANIPCYQTDAVGCFDPTKVVVRLRDNINGIIVCVHDHAWDRYEAFQSHGLDRALGSVANDARRRGPIYNSRIYINGSDQLIEGIAERYCVRVTSEKPIPEPLKSELLRILRSLTLDGISVTSVRQDGNDVEPV